MDRTAAFDKMKEVIIDQLEIDGDKIVETATFTDDLGADSLDMLQLITALEDEMGISIPDEQFESIKTIGDALDVIVVS